MLDEQITQPETPQPKAAKPTLALGDEHIAMIAKGLGVFAIAATGATAEYLTGLGYQIVAVDKAQLAFDTGKSLPALNPGCLLLSNKVPQLEGFDYLRSEGDINIYRKQEDPA